MARSVAQEVRGGAFHEAGHAVVGHFYGLQVTVISVGPDGGGNTCFANQLHLPLIDRIAICIAGKQSQKLFNEPGHEMAALCDQIAIDKMLEDELGSEANRDSAYVDGVKKAAEILNSKPLLVIRLAQCLIRQREINGEEFLRLIQQ